jgi:two-component system, OmpR family, response regulator
MRLLLVEDDVKLVRALERGFMREGYAVDVALDGDEAVARAEAHAHDAVVLDLMLPGRDGFTVCRELRRRNPGVPILILTARGEVSERIRGLDGGADDYLVKPFDFGELLARLRAHIRRRNGASAPVLSAGPLRMDLGTHVVTWDGRPIELSRREFDVLECLALSSDEPVSRAQVLASIWGEAYGGSPNVVDVYVGYLRRKLERVAGVQPITTVRGVGFLLEAR